MAVQHARHPVHGVQFHPESVLTEHGYRLVDHFLHGVPATPRPVPVAADCVARARGPRAEHARLGPAAGGSRAVIIESIVTTMAPDGSDQLRAHGRRVGRRDASSSSRFSRPPPSATCATRGWPSSISPTTSCCSRRAPSRARSSPGCRPTVVRGAVLEAACSWRELEVVSIDDTPPRSRIETRVVHRGCRREFLGFNRARHAVLEAAILATRTHLIPAEEIRAEFARLQVIVDKTAGPARAGGDGPAHRVCPIAVASSSRRRPGSTSGCSTCAGALGRRFGGLGAAVPAPSLLLEAARDDRADAPTGPTRSGPLEFAERFLAHHGLDRRGPSHRASRHPAAQRTRLGHPAGSGGGARAGGAARPPDRARGAGAGGGPGPPIGDRHLDIRPGRLHRGRWPADRERTTSRRCWPALPFRRRGAAWSRCRRGAGVERRRRGRGVRAARRRRRSGRSSGSPTWC